MTLNLKRFAIALAFVAASSEAFATKPEVMFCNGCTSEQENAMVLADTAVNPGTIAYIGDTVHHTVHAYTTYADVDDSVRPPKHTRYAETASADPDIVTGVLGGINFYNAAPVGWSKHITLYTNRSTANQVYSPDPHVNIYNVMGAGPLRNTFLNWVNGSYYSPNYANALGAFFTILTATHVIAASPSVRQTIMLDDGGHVDVVYNAATNTEDFDNDSARDSHSNNVPYLGLDGHIHNLGGTHDFAGSGNPQDQNNFENLMTQLNVLIERGGVPVNHPSHYIPWICVETYTENGHLVLVCQEG